MKEQIKRKTPETKSPNSHPCELFIGDSPANLLKIGYFLANGNSKAEIRLNRQILWINSIDKDGTATASFTDRFNYNSQGKGWQEVQIQLTEKDGQILINTPNFDDAQKAFFDLEHKAKWHKKENKVTWKKAQQNPNPPILESPQANWHSNQTSNPSQDLPKVNWHQNPTNSQNYSQFPDLYFQRQFTPEGKFRPDCGIHAVLHLTQNLGLTDFRNHQVQSLIQNLRNYLGKSTFDWLTTPDLPKLFAYLSNQNELKLRLFAVRSEMWKDRLAEFEGFIFNLNENHWVSVAKIRGKFYLFDSMTQLPKEISFQELQQIYMTAFGAFSFNK